MIQSRTDTFLGAAGIELLERSWEPDGDPRGAVVVVHGLGEHSGRYEELGSFLAHEGFRVLSYDQRGHGRSGGPPGWVESFDHFLDDLSIVLARAASRSDGTPVVLLGHSMGGLIVAAYVLERDELPDFLVLSSPAIVPIVEEGVTPGAIDAAALSSDPAVQESYRTDPLVLRERVTPDLLGRIFDGVVLVSGRAGEIDIPLLLIHGDRDTLCSAEGAGEYVGQTATSDRTVRIYPGGLHEMFNETCREEVFADLREWLRLRVPAPSG